MAILKYIQECPQCEGTGNIRPTGNPICANSKVKPCGLCDDGEIIHVLTEENTEICTGGDLAAYQHAADSFDSLIQTFMDVWIPQCLIITL